MTHTLTFLWTMECIASQHGFYRTKLTCMLRELSNCPENGLLNDVAATYMLALIMELSRYANYKRPLDLQCTISLVHVSHFCCILHVNHLLHVASVRVGVCTAVTLQGGGSYLVCLVLQESGQLPGRAEAGQGQVQRGV